MASGFHIDAKGLMKDFESFNNRADSAIRMYAEQGAVKMENYAKKNRIWTDRTGHARQRLKGSVDKLSNGYRISIAHGVDYGVYLEMAHEKKYSILPDTVRKVGQQEILPGFEKLLERLG